MRYRHCLHIWYLVGCNILLIESSVIFFTRLYTYFYAWYIHSCVIILKPFVVYLFDMKILIDEIKFNITSFFGS